MFAALNIPTTVSHEPEILFSPINVCQHPWLHTMPSDTDGDNAQFLTEEGAVSKIKIKT